ncbi:mycothiol conjugate amidase Mca [Phytohabitans rumicis]|uniref:Mycothiol S-conjugate amidase n=1 Tax=Phytohabitans rumicis TaxID=1076125 RepID=A0A6V8LFL6_9ACTN|nr:mycothiol conjugate amidase Mca [Phytohabitans rumicis]GFJ91425.1 mycothiol S-conjugate amidase [Phytohabitans rumicis]
MAEQLRLMAVHAHPDDESSKGAATMAKYAADGVQVLVATCTGGERGSVLNPKMDRPDVWDNIAEIRKAEMAAARAILGVDQAWLGYVDSGLPEGDPLPPLPDGCFALQDVQAAAGPLVRLIREFRPHVVLTYDENGGYPHPDHIMCHKISVVAFDGAADAEQYPGLGEPWQPLKLYYQHSFTRAKFRALHEGMVAAGLESPYEEMLNSWTDEGTDMGHRITTRVECADYFAVRDDALRAHATQVDPDGPWFRAPLDVQRKVWPTEDFELARSLVDGSLPETDLFAGVREAGRTV